MITASMLTCAGAVWLAVVQSKLTGQNSLVIHSLLANIDSRSLSCSKSIWFVILLVIVLSAALL